MSVALLAAVLAAVGSTSPTTPTTPTTPTAMLVPGVNESFETMTTLPAEWPVVEWAAGASKASIETGDDAADGKHYLHLDSKTINHVRVMVPTSVEPGAIYRFSARVRATGPKPVPAVLGIDGAAGTISDPVPGDGQWHARRLYVQTNAADKVTLMLSLGWFGQTVKGQADFDLIKVKKVDAAPAGVGVAQAVGQAAAGAAGAAAPKPAVSTKGASKAVLPLTALLLILLAGSGRILLRSDDVD